MRSYLKDWRRHSFFISFSNFSEQSGIISSCAFFLHVFALRLTAIAYRGGAPVAGFRNQPAAVVILAGFSGVC